MKIVKTVCFVLVSMAAGLLSGFSHLVLFGGRGAILGGTLAIGLIAYEMYRKIRVRLSAGATLIAASVTSLAAAQLMEGWAVVVRRLGFGPWNRGDFSMNEISQGPFGYTFLTCFLIMSGLFFCYRSCAQRRYFSALFSLAIPPLSVIPRVVSAYGMSGVAGFANGCLLLFVLGLLPFLMMWICSAALFFDFFSPKTYEETAVQPEPPASETERSDT